MVLSSRQLTYLRIMNVNTLLTNFIHVAFECTSHQIPCLAFYQTSALLLAATVSTIPSIPARCNSYCCTSCLPFNCIYLLYYTHSYTAVMSYGRDRVGVATGWSKGGVAGGDVFSLVSSHQETNPEGNRSSK